MPNSVTVGTRSIQLLAPRHDVTVDSRKKGGRFYIPPVGPVLDENEIYLNFKKGLFQDLSPNNLPVTQSGATIGLAPDGTDGVAAILNSTSGGTNMVAIDISNDAKWQLIQSSAEDFGYEGWFYPNSYPYARSVYCGYGYANGSNYAVDPILLGYVNGQTSVLKTNSTSLNPAVGQWHHFSVNRIGDTVYVYHAGKLLWSFLWSSQSSQLLAAALTGSKAKILFGRSSGGAGYAGSIYLGYFHMRIGSAIRTAEFDVPPITGDY